MCAVVIAAPGEPLQFAEGECRGEILPEERGSNGFGYDPIFYLAGLGRTMAELTRAEKNTLSHRARAVQAALPVLRGFLRRIARSWWLVARRFLLHRKLNFASGHGKLVCQG